MPQYDTTIDVEVGLHHASPPPSHCGYSPMWISCEYWGTGSVATRPGLDELTEREHEVLAEMAQGKSNAAIANALGISESAVEKHISTLLAKLGLDPDDATVNRRVAAVLAFFRSAGLTAGRNTNP